MLPKALEGLHCKVHEQPYVGLHGPPTQLLKPSWMHKVVDRHTRLHLVLLLWHGEVVCWFCGVLGGVWGVQ